MTSQARAAVVLLAAGDGRRVGAGCNKVLLPLGGLPVFAWSLLALRPLRYVDPVVVVVRPQDRETVTDAGSELLPGRRLELVAGGETRHASEWNALQMLAGCIEAHRVDVVVVHDAARPLAGTELFARVVSTAARHGAAVPGRWQSALLPGKAQAPDRPPEQDATRPPDRPPEQDATRPPDRPPEQDATGPCDRPPEQDATRPCGLVAVQTPQAFRARPLLAAYRAAERDGFEGTDTAGCVQRYTDLEVRWVPAPATNLKITFPDDVGVAARLLARLPAEAGGLGQRLEQQNR